MATAAEIHNQNEPSTATLLQGIVTDFQDLIKQQLQLTRVEIKTDLQKTLDGALVLAFGAGGCLVGAILISLTLVQVLYTVVSPVPDPARLPLWACYGIVAVVVTAISGVLMYTGFQKIAHLPLGEKTMEGLKENVGWQLDNAK